MCDTISNNLVCNFAFSFMILVPYLFSFFVFFMILASAVLIIPYFVCFLLSLVLLPPLDLFDSYTFLFFMCLIALPSLVLCVPHFSSFFIVLTSVVLFIPYSSLIVLLSVGLDNFTVNVPPTFFVNSPGRW